jgi:hypothetical protein
MTTKRNAHPDRDHLEIAEVTITPELAVEMLEANKHNRPLSDQHVKRLSRQIIEGKWIVNGDSIKFSETGDVLDGQHRLWAIIYARMPVRTLVVRGIANEAFATIDAVRKMRTGADLLHLKGMVKYRQVAAGALQWMVRYQRGVIEEWKSPENRVENSDIEQAFAQHPQITTAAERASQLRYVCTPTMLAFLYDAIAQQNEQIADRMMNVLEDATNVSPDDPFFLLRSYMIQRHKKPKDPVVTVALTFKAANAAYRRRKMETLLWRRQGAVPEPFPLLEVRAA